MNLSEATRVAQEVAAVLKPFCHQFEIAGSVRRGKRDMIKDVEIVLVPNNQHLHDLVRVINSQWGIPQIGKFPSKYCRIRGRYNLDIFTCSPETFGLNYFIRTGPDSFCRRALSDWKRVSNGGYSNEARLHNADGTIVPTPTEVAVFEALKWRYVRPENRV